MLHSEDNGGTPTITQVLTAPWFCFFRPLHAGYKLARASRRQMWLVVATLWVAQIAVFVAVWTWAGQYEWKSNYVAEYRPWGEVVRDWFADDGTPIRALAASQLLFMLFWYFLAGTLLLPRVHPGLEAWRSLGISGRAVVAAAGPAILIGAAFSVMNSCQYRQEMEWARIEYDRGIQTTTTEHPVILAYPNVPTHTLIAAIRWLSLPTLLLYMSFAARGARHVIQLPERAVICEDCGYELTHQSETGRCTECGTELIRSIDPQLARPGTRWEIRPSFVGWLNTSRLALFHPSKLYRATRARESDALSTAFSCIHYLLLGAFLFLIFRFAEWLPNYLKFFNLSTQFQAFESLSAWSTPNYRATMKTGAVLTALWACHRGLGFLMVLVASMFRWVTPGTRLAKLIDYQVVFLWVVLFIGGVWAKMMGLDSLNGIYEVFAGSGRAAVSQFNLFLIFQLGISPPVAYLLVLGAFIGPPILLILFWARRYVLAFRAVRRANF